MPAYTTDAFVLRRLQYGETDNILTLFSQERGRFGAIAKGARKAVSRLSGATEILTLGRYGLASGKTLEIVTQVEVQESFSDLKSDLLRLAHGLYFVDLVDHSVEDHAPNPVLFKILRAALTLLQSALLPQVVARWFEVQLLRDLGYGPRLGTCIVCQVALPGNFSPDDRFGFAAQQGGALCPHHAHAAASDDQTALSFAALKLLQNLDRMELTAGDDLFQLALPDPKSLGDIRLALRRTLRCRLETDLKSLGFLDSVGSM